MRAVLAFLVIGLACPAHAFDLPLPDGAEQTADQAREADTIRLPSGPVEDDMLPRLHRDGDIRSRAWRVPTTELSTLQLLEPLRATLAGSGWDVVFACQAEACGGFDFRLALPTLPAPAMFVDLFDFRYLLARRGMGARSEHLALIISRRGRNGYVQVTHIMPRDQVMPRDQGTAEKTRRAPVPGATGASQEDLLRILQEQGHVVLHGLDFGSGAGTLGPGPHDSLERLAGFLLSNPGARVVLVGHTDSVGALDTNRSLSLSRARSVRQRLIDDHAVPPEQIEAHGIGYLAPRASNTTPAGRDRNRRVEAVLLEMRAP